jgi:hypothetical protein
MVSHSAEVSSAVTCLTQSAMPAESPAASTGSSRGGAVDSPSRSRSQAASVTKGANRISVLVASPPLTSACAM